MHLVTDRRRLAPSGSEAARADCLLDQSRRAADAGVDALQIREPDLESRALADLVEAVLEATHGSTTRVLVNDRLDVAIAAGAHGVHLRGDSIPPAAARSLAPAGFLVGCSVHSVEEARAGTALADYLIAGTVWRTPSKPAAHRLLGLDGLAAITAAATVPVLAIGGVTEQTAAQVAAAGASGVAAIGMFIGTVEREPSVCRTVNLQAIVATLRQRFDTPGRRS